MTPTKIANVALDPASHSTFMFCSISCSRGLPRSRSSIDPGGQRYQQVVSFGVVAPGKPTAARLCFEHPPWGAERQTRRRATGIAAHFNAKAVGQQLNVARQFIDRQAAQHFQTSKSDGPRKGAGMSLAVIAPACSICSSGGRCRRRSARSSSVERRTKRT